MVRLFSHKTIILWNIVLFIAKSTAFQPHKTTMSGVYLKNVALFGIRQPRL
jgi:hypothetical protein